MNKEQNLKTIYELQIWEPKIKPFISKFFDCKTPIETIQLLKTVYTKCYNYQSKQNQNRYKPSFKVLYNLYQDRVTALFNQIVRVILMQQNQWKKSKVTFPMLQCQTNNSFLLYKIDVLVFMMMMALGLTAMLTGRENYPYTTDFGWIFSQEEYKTRTIIQYFYIQLSRMNQKSYNQQLLLLGRRSQEMSIQQIIQKFKGKKMTKIQIAEKDSIEDYFGDLKVDFANEYIGGGALMAGLVQEEIMFANHPQMYVSVLFCQKMDPNQSIYFSGFKKYFSNKGYASTAQYSGKQQHKYSYSAEKVAEQHIVAIDANCYPSTKSRDNLYQFQKAQINRQLLKAYTGFSYNGEVNKKSKDKRKLRVITGNWGCGAFNGNIPLKFMIQWLACSMAEKECVYCTFGSKEFNSRQEIIEKINHLKVGEVYRMVIKCAQQICKQNNNLFQQMQRYCHKHFDN